MIVKIGDTFYDSTKEPILLILSEQEKEHLKNMGDTKKYCSFPSDSDTSKIREWMQVSDEIMEKVVYGSE